MTLSELARAANAGQDDTPKRKRPALPPNIRERLWHEQRARDLARQRALEAEARAWREATEVCRQRFDTKPTGG